jgi:hypothetical protein
VEVAEGKVEVASRREGKPEGKMTNQREGKVKVAKKERGEEKAKKEWGKEKAKEDVRTRSSTCRRQCASWRA